MAARHAHSADTDAALTATLAQALWGQPLRIERLLQQASGPARAVLVGDGNAGHVLHLPVANADADAAAPAHALAVAAHAAAHLRFGDAPQARAGLKPVQQALRGVLEDARVEWLAVQELPGLRRVWWPYHASHAAGRGSGFDELLARLSASLLEPAHVDPHPWIARVKAVFFEADGHTLALRSADAVRQAASRLGNDIGQMRLPFNPRSYVVQAGYRDDNSHLWWSDVELPPSEALLAQAAGASGSGAAEQGTALPDTAPDATDDTVLAQHPEWDHRIRRYRADWCRVTAPVATAPQRLALTDTLAPARRLAQRLARLQGRPVRSGGRAASGEHLHAAALVEAWADLRAGRTPDLRVHQRVIRPRPPLAVLLLLDVSASTAMAGALQGMQRAALTAALALQRLGERSALWAFSSQGRHRVQMPCLKGWDERLAHAALPAQHGAGSTRLGAALRHGLWLSAVDARRHPGHQRVIVLLTDGELHDVDVHDPAYLPADLARAAREAAALGVAVRALVFSPGQADALDAALGARRGVGVPDAAALPQALWQALSNVTP